MKCKWCGLEADIEEFDMSPDKKVVWCPDCDGLTYVDAHDDKRRMLLLLESRTKGERASLNKTPLRKRLSPLRYPGGKSKVIDQIYERLDKEKLDTFVELFAGGASLGLSLLDAGKINRLILNDADPRVVNFWRTCIHRSEEFCETIENNVPTLRDYKEAKESLRIFERSRLTRTGHLEEAYDFLLVNRLSFGGMQKGGPICGKYGNDEDLRQRWNSKALISRIRHIADMKEKIQVDCHDAIRLLTERDGWQPENSTLFIDPPYTVAGRQLYQETFEGKHEELAELINEFYICWPGPDIVLTYDDCELVRELYPYAQEEVLHTSWSIVRPQ